MKKAALIILDGWGIGDGSDSDAISMAHTPVYDRLISTMPNSTLKTYGENVGLPKGQMGNSEVGHLNIGAGRVVFQDLARIDKEVSTGSLGNNHELKKAIELAISGKKRIHLMGLLSHGGVHSSQHHLHALIDVLEKAGLVDIYIHAFTDGRDTDPKSAVQNVTELESFLHGKSSRLVSMIGRYYAMDRDKRWERIKKAYDLLVHRQGSVARSFTEECNRQYEEGITDEFFEPSYKDIAGSKIENGDVVLCFNFRTDRCRQITEALTQRDLPDHEMYRLDLNYFTMTKYDETFNNVHVLYDKENLVNTMGEVVSNAGASQLRIAETEKYPHVTFFFSGGREKVFNGESRIVVDSPKVATYDLQPEMSADKVAEKCIGQIENESPDFICLNFANPDMVGHTGVVSAILKAVEKVDELLGAVTGAALQHDYSIVIIADHGNADRCKMPDGSPHTAHTLNPVPCILLGSDRRIKNGILADVAPTLLELLGIEQPPEMTGSSLLE